MKCVKTGEDMVHCEHCSDPDYFDVPDEGPDYETLGRAFKSQYSGSCTVEYRHHIKRGDLVSRVRRADNPNILVTGVACKTCTLMLPRGRE